MSNQSTTENSLKIALGKESWLCKETDAPIKDIQSMTLKFEVLGEPPSPCLQALDDKLFYKSRMIINTLLHVDPLDLIAGVALPSKILLLTFSLLFLMQTVLVRVPGKEQGGSHTISLEFEASNSSQTAEAPHRRQKPINEPAAGKGTHPYHR